MTRNQLQHLFNEHREASLKRRYLPLSLIEPLIKKLNGGVEIQVLGKSVQKRPIYSLKIGHGPKRVLMWSQMHGNESTTTKVMFDLLNCVGKNSDANHLLEDLTLMIIPMLNPDGAEVYTRLNANQIDLNRDAQQLTQPESRALRQAFDVFEPDFCFNLHGQRTIFSAGDFPKSATLSFLSPAQDIERSVTTTRKNAMEVIAVINDMLQDFIPNQVGIYDDSFNINCVGDMFQSLGVPTILFEAGHFWQDYHRNETRKFLFYSILVALDYISKNKVGGELSEAYFKIPNNKKIFLDLIVRNADQKGNDIGIMYNETLVNHELLFIPKIDEIGDLGGKFGHREIDAKGTSVSFGLDRASKVGDEIDFVEIGTKKYSLKIENS